MEQFDFIMLRQAQHERIEESFNYNFLFFKINSTKELAPPAVVCLYFALRATKSKRAGPVLRSFSEGWKGTDKRVKPFYVV